jgi:hypothetical protein
VEGSVRGATLHGLTERIPSLVATNARVNRTTDVISQLIANNKRVSGTVTRLCGLVVRVRFPALPDSLRSSGSGTGSTQLRGYI